MSRQTTHREWKDVTGAGFEIHAAERHDGLVCRVEYWTRRLERALRDSRASTVVIEPYWEDRNGKGLAFLEQFAGQITHFSTDPQTAPDAAVASRLTNLEELTLGSPVEAVDFSRLTRLRKVLLSHPAGLGNLASCEALEDLALFSVRLSDLRGLHPLRRLRRLYLNSMHRLSSLEGLEGLPLEIVQLVYVPRLQSVGPLPTLPLRELEIVGGKRIGDVERLGATTTLERLAMPAMPSAPSLAFLSRLERLERLRVGGVDTAIEGASLAPLTRLTSLKDLGIGDVRKASGVERLGSLAALESLSLDRGPELASLAFLRGLTRLRVLVLSRTRVADGDFSGLLTLPCLEELVIRPWRTHYHPSVEELEAATTARRGPVPSKPAGAVDIPAMLNRMAEPGRRMSAKARAGRPASQPASGARLERVLKLLHGVAGAEILNPEELYAGGFCSECNQPQGERTAVPLKLQWRDAVEASCDGGVAAMGDSCRPVLTYYSEAFLAQLAPAERDLFQWRRIERAGRGTKAVFELVRSSAHLNLAALKGGNPEPFRCDRCGHADSPEYTVSGELPEWLDLEGDDLWRGQPEWYVSAKALPDPLPSCMTVGSVPERFVLAVTPERWARFNPNRGMRGLRSTHDVGVVAPELVES